VRLYAKDYFAPIGVENFIDKPVTEDITAVLVFDLPKAVSNIKPVQTIQWNKTNEELFEWGLANARRNNPVKIHTHRIGNHDIKIVEGVHFFVPNIILDLVNHPELVGSKGSLIGIPNRHAVLVYPIENLEVITAINVLIPTIKGLYQDGPGEISLNLFWYYDNQFTTLPYELSDNTLQFRPTEAFLNVLELLGPGDE